MTHCWNLCGPGLLGSLFAGAKTVLCRNGSADEILNCIEMHEVTTVSYTHLYDAGLFVFLPVNEMRAVYDLESDYDNVVFSEQEQESDDLGTCLLYTSDPWAALVMIP